MPVRAYTESYLLASIMGDNRYLYPGFQQSVDPNQSINHPIGTQSLWPKTNAPNNNGSAPSRCTSCLSRRPAAT
ncbi:hypothetical protein I549_1121 [Mycobacterium avium subsp. avium 2285 (R)]|nr:hypothetical protein I549_1121 [Mycobacterium avium subsp. avium 2285 (R)]